MRRGELGFTLIEIMVVIAIIGTLAAAVSVGIPMVQERSQRLGCQRNLDDIGKVYTVKRIERPGRPPYSGSALLYHYMKNKDIDPGKEEVLLCPGDENAVFPRDDAHRKEWREVDLNNPPADMCSYAVRDFKKFQIKKDADTRQILASDRQGPDGRTAHHKGGLNVLFTDGSARFMAPEQLGLTGGADAAIVVGPDSDHEQLKCVVTSVEGGKD